MSTKTAIDRSEQGKACSKVGPSTIDVDFAWAESYWQGTHTPGLQLNMRGVVVTGLRNGIIAWARLYMEPVHDRTI